MPTTPTDLHLPDGLPVVPGVALSARYLLTGASPSDRGDTLDAFALPGGRTGLLVADVVGAGYPAAVTAAQVRAVVRERLVAGASPVDVVRALHRWSDHAPEVAGTTLLVGVLDGDGTFDHAGAGRPSPLVWDADLVPHATAGLLGRPIGVPGVLRGAQVRVPADGGVLLHTDGLLGPGRGPRAVLAQGLREARPDLPGAGVHDHLDALAEQVLAAPATRGTLADDVAVLLARRVSAPAALSLTLPAIEAALVQAEQALGEWLLDVGAGLGDQIALQHVLGELGRNVVEHAYTGAGLQARPRVVQVEAHHEGGSVRLRIADCGSWTVPRHSLGGRGIVLASGLVDDLRMLRRESGTQVEARLDLRRPVLLYAARRAAPPADLDPLRNAALDGVSGGPGPERRHLQLGVTPGRIVAGGSVDGDTVDALAAALVEATVAGSASAVVDLSAVHRLASAGVRCLALAGRRCRRSGSRLHLVAAQGTPADRVLRALDIPHARAGGTGRD